MLVVFIIYPLYAGINLSLTDRYLLKPDSGKFIGLENYITFVHSHEFAFYLRNTFNWTFWSVFGAVILGTFLAVQLNKPLGPVRPFYRSLVLIPWIMPITATSIIWRWIYDGQWGILNYVLTRLHLINVYIPFLGQKLFIWPSLVVFFVWKVYPFVYVMVLSALQTVPTELNDSAVVDGASKIKIFWRINFPILVPTLVIVTLLLAVWTFNEFAAIWLMTKPGQVKCQ